MSHFIPLSISPKSPDYEPPSLTSSGYSFKTCNIIEFAKAKKKKVNATKSTSVLSRATFDVKTQ